MQSGIHLALVGSGPSAIYLLMHLWRNGEALAGCISRVSIFEKNELPGVGMPYHPATTDRYHLANISSDEIPSLPQSLVGWLRSLESGAFAALDLQGDEISGSKIYPRLVLGRYLCDQYHQLVDRLTAAGLQIDEHPRCEIVDIAAVQRGGYELEAAGGERFTVDRVVIATGHSWTAEDDPANGFYASPWPIGKILPDDGELYDFEVGTLGASLSAFDVITSLAHRHGKFFHDEGRLRYEPDPGTDRFKLVMHALNGWLPHLQFDQVEPLREIYRHVSPVDLLDLRDEGGFLRIEQYFDKVCRPLLREAFRKDDHPEMVKKLENPEYRLVDFVESMSRRHDHEDPFEGMAIEMVEARESVDHGRPVHWKEVLDDLMYTLNFHADLLPAEDHGVLHDTVMPFLMNVIAAMPLESAESLLALHAAGKIDLIAGEAKISAAGGRTRVSVVAEGEADSGDEREYRMFVDCSGQKPIGPDTFPFPSLVWSGQVQPARIPFKDPARGPEQLSESLRKHVTDGSQSRPVYQPGGVGVDGAYRLLGADGEPEAGLVDLALSHVSGLRPYSYGLQNCSDSAAIVVASWLEEIESGAPPADAPEAIAELNEKASDSSES